MRRLIKFTVFQHFTAAVLKCLHEKVTNFQCGLKSHACLHDRRETHTAVKLKAA